MVQLLWNPFWMTHTLINLTFFKKRPRIMLAGFQTRASFASCYSIRVQVFDGHLGLFLLRLTTGRSEVLQGIDFRMALVATGIWSCECHPWNKHPFLHLSFSQIGGFQFPKRKQHVNLHPNKSLETNTKVEFLLYKIVGLSVSPP